MAKNHIQSDQIIHNATLSELAPAGDTELLDLLPSINSRLTDPLSLTTSGLVLTVGSSIITIGPNGKKRGIPQLDSVDLGNLSGTFDFTAGPGGAVGVTGDCVTETIPSMTSAYFLRAGVEVRSDKKIYVVFGAEGASASAAGAPPFSEGTLQCGEYLLEENGAGGFVVPSGATEQAVVTQFGTGSGGGGSGTGLGNINYVKNYKGDIDTNNWQTYNDSAASPVDGIGGTVDGGFTLTKTDTSPLRGKGSFLLTKPASDVQGHGVSAELNDIDVADRGRIMEIAFDYDASAGYSTQMSVYVYNITGTSLVQIWGNQGLPRGKGRAKIRFKCPDAAEQLRLIFHVTSTDTTAFTYKFDLVSVGPVFETDVVKKQIVTSSAHSFSPGDIVGFTGTVWNKVAATPAGWLPGGRIGLVQEVLDGYNFVLIEYGFFELTSPNNLGGGGRTFYLSETAGEYIEDENQQIQVELFRTFSQFSGFFDPKPAKRLDENPNSSFKPLRFTTGNTVQFSGGAIKVDDGPPIFSGTATTEFGDRNFTLDLGSLVASPTDDTTYHLYIDRYALSTTTFTDTGRTVYLANAAAHFELLTDEPKDVDSYRFIHVGVFHSADSGNTFNGTGSVYAPAVDRTHDTGISTFAHPESFSTTLTTATTTTVAHGLSAKPQVFSAMYYDGTDEYPVDISSHISDVDDTNITISSVGLTFGSGETLVVTAFYHPSVWSHFTSPKNTFESPWYSSTGTTQVAHNLGSAENIRGVSVLEWDVSNDKYRVYPMSASPFINFDDTNIYMDWTGWSPSATLQYKAVVAAAPVPAALPKTIGGYTKFVGRGPGAYANLAAALAEAESGDSILVLTSESISSAITVSVNDIRICFMPSVKITVTSGTKGLILSGNNIDLENPWIVADFSGTLTAGIDVSGEGNEITKAKVEANDAGVTITDAYLLTTGANLNFIRGYMKATAGSITNPITDNSGEVGNDYAIRQ